jgi:acetyltransferase-like isoleucine patch superfamily enzyme
LRFGSLVEDRVDQSGGSGLQGAKALAYKALAWAKRHEAEGARAIYGARRAAFIARMKLQAAWHGAEVQVDVAPDVRFGKDIAITVFPGSRNSVRIGPGSRIGDRVLFILNDGRIDIGDDVEVRRDTSFMMWGGSLEIAGGNILSWANVIHCASSIRLGRMTSTNEFVTIVDSSHYFTTPEEFFYHNTKTGPIEVGMNTWICSKATLARNAKIGDHCIIAGNSIVTGEVPSGHLASGVPATIVRELDLPWRQSAPKLVGAVDPRKPAAKRAPRKKPAPPAAAPPEA